MLVHDRRYQKRTIFSLGEHNNDEIAKNDRGISEAVKKIIDKCEYILPKRVHVFLLHCEPIVVNEEVPKRSRGRPRK